MYKLVKNFSLKTAAVPSEIVKIIEILSLIILSLIINRYRLSQYYIYFIEKLTKI